MEFYVVVSTALHQTTELYSVQTHATYKLLCLNIPQHSHLIWTALEWDSIGWKPHLINFFPVGSVFYDFTLANTRRFYWSMVDILSDEWRYALLFYSGWCQIILLVKGENFSWKWSSVNADRLAQFSKWWDSRPKRDCSWVIAGRAFTLQKHH